MLVWKAPMDTASHVSHPAFCNMSFALIKHENLDQQKLLHYLAFILELVFSVWFFKCSLKSTTPPSVLHLLAPNFCPMIMPCV